MKLILPLIVLFAFFGADAQVRTFKWNDEMCEYSGTYNARKYTEAKLRNTLRLLSHSELRLSSVDATVWKYEEIAKLDVAGVDKAYNDLIDELEHLEYVSTPYMDMVRQQKLTETRRLYQLIRTTMTAYTKPEVLRNYKGADACMLKFGEPIVAGGDKLLAAWRKVNLDSQSKNSDPARLKRIFDEQMASPERLKFALVETMSFGWWNCANGYVKYSDVSESDRPMREFKKLFIKVRTLRCDEP